MAELTRASWGGSQVIHYPPAIAAVKAMLIALRPHIQDTFGIFSDMPNKQKDPWALGMNMQRPWTSKVQYLEKSVPQFPSPGTNLLNGSSSKEGKRCRQSKSHCLRTTTKEKEKGGRLIVLVYWLTLYPLLLFLMKSGFTPQIEGEEWRSCHHQQKSRITLQCTGVQESAADDILLR